MEKLYTPDPKDVPKLISEYMDKGYTDISVKWDEKLRRWVVKGRE